MEIARREAPGPDFQIRFPKPDFHNQISKLPTPPDKLLIIFLFFELALQSQDQSEGGYKNDPNPTPPYQTPARKASKVLHISAHFREIFLIFRLIS
jgi:hypothetical protein